MTEPSAGTSSTGPSGDAPAKPVRTSPMTFIRQVIAELRKVVWPTQNQLVTYFLVVLVFVLVLIGYVVLLDLGFGKAIFAVFGGEPTTE